MGGVAADFEAQKRKTRLTAAGIGVAALIAAFFGARALGLLKLGASTNPAGLRVASKGAPSALQMPGDVPPPNLQQKGDAAVPNLQEPGRVDPPALQQDGTRKQMPADVRDWLNHLQECEKRKVALASDQNAEAMVAATRLQGMGGAANFLNNDGEVDPGSDENKDASQVGRDKILSFRPPWDQLVAFFNSKTPPAECAPLASNYNRALSELGGSMGDIADLLNGASKDPASALKKAYAMQGKSPQQIDKYFNGASQKYGDICQKYDTKPWFEIKSDVTMGGNLGIFGNLGNGGLGAGLGQ